MARSSSCKIAALLAVCGAAALGQAGPASADAKVVAVVEVLAPAKGPDEQEDRRTRTVTSYFKGDRARVEAEGGPVLIFDLKAARVFTLNPADRTYTTAALKEFVKPAISAQPGSGGQPPPIELRANSRLRLKVGDRTQTRAGHEATSYDVIASVRLEPDTDDAGPGAGPGGGPGGRGMPGGGGRGGGMPGGGFPGGGGRGGGGPGAGGPSGGAPGGGGPGGSGGPRQAPVRAFPSVDVTGQVWLTKDIQLPGSPWNRMALLPLYTPVLDADPLGRGLLRPLAEQVAKLKAFPVAIDLTIVSTGSGPQGQGAPPGDGSQGAPRRGSESPRGGAKSVTASWQLKSISQDGLDDGLFVVPEGFERAAKASDRAERSR